MTAPIGTIQNRFTGLREFSQVTNSYGGHIISAGTAHNFILPFYPDRIDWAIQAASAALTTGIWYRDQVSVTNEITVAVTPGGFYNEHLVISGIALVAGLLVVTTSANHNLSTNDRVVLTKIIGTIAAALNNKEYVVVVQSATTFALYDTYGIPISAAGTYTSSGQVTKIGPLLGDPTQPVSPAVPHRAIIDYPPLVTATFGTVAMGSSTNVVFFTAWQFNSYWNFGTAT